jgi:hypothetical protein
MRRLKVSCVCVLLALWASSAVWADAAADLAELMQAGRYDEVVAAATEELGKTEEPDKQLQYLRGYAAFRIAWYGLAEKDLAPLGDYAPWEKWPPASEFAERITKIRALAPENVHEIRKGNACLFRIYYEEANPWTDAIVKTLPEAYDQVCGFYGVDLAETAVFIFSDGPRYNAFFTVASGHAPTDWQWATGSSGVLAFCQRDAEGWEPSQPGTAYQRSSIAHEFSHCLLRRFLGTVRCPPWLDEGLAMFCGALMAPEDFQRNDSAVARMMRGQTALPVSVLADRDQFYSNGLHRTAYAEGFAMVRFMESEIGRDGILKLLTLLRDEGDLDKALEKGWGTNPELLYAAWYGTTMRLLDEGKLGP